MSATHLPQQLPHRALRKRTADVLGFCKAEVAAGRSFPKPAAIAARMGWSPQSAADCLVGLAAYGHIKKTGVEPRTRRALYALLESESGESLAPTSPHSTPGEREDGVGAGASERGIA